MSCTSPTFCIGTPQENWTGWTVWNGSSSRTLHDQASPSLTDIESVSCVSSTFCMALLNGSAIRFTGSGWVDAPGLTGADAVSCTSATSCTATALTATSQRVSRSYNGSTWGSPVPAATVSALSCPAASFSLGVGASGVSTFNGSAWSAPSAPIPTTAAAVVSCSSRTFCAVASGNKLVTYNGTTFGAVSTVLDDPKPFNHVGCASSTFCMGADRLTAVNFGTSGFVSRATIGRLGDPSLILDGMTCVSPALCFAEKTLGFSGEPALARYDGTGWTDLDPELPPSVAGSVSCVSVTFCAAVSDRVFFFNGSTWNPSTPLGYTRVSCGAQNFCVATAAGASGTGISTVFNGGSWTAPAVMGATAGAEPIELSCHPTRICVAARPERAGHRLHRWFLVSAGRHRGRRPGGRRVVLERRHLLCGHLDGLRGAVHGVRLGGADEDRLHRQAHRHFLPQRELLHRR